MWVFHFHFCSWRILLLDIRFWADGSFLLAVFKHCSSVFWPKWLLMRNLIFIQILVLCWLRVTSFYLCFQELLFFSTFKQFDYDMSKYGCLCFAECICFLWLSQKHYQKLGNGTQLLRVLETRGLKGSKASPPRTLRGEVILPLLHVLRSIGTPLLLCLVATHFAFFLHLHIAFSPVLLKSLPRSPFFYFRVIYRWI